MIPVCLDFGWGFPVFCFGSNFSPHFGGLQVAKGTTVHTDEVLYDGVNRLVEVSSFHDCVTIIAEFTTIDCFEMLYFGHI